MNMEWHSYDEVMFTCKNKDLVVFGAGHFGQRLIYRLMCDHISNIVVYDNDKNKWGNYVFGIQIKKFPIDNNFKEDAVYLIAGIEDGGTSNAEKIFKFLYNYINEKKIFLIRDETLSTISTEARIESSKQYVRNLIEKKMPYNDDDKINKIRSITYRYLNFSKLGTTGGPGKILYTQELLLGDMYNGIELLYSFKEKENLVSLGLDYACANILGAVEFARQISEKESNTAYIAHDIFSGAGLAANGKKYILVYHNQGEMVYEMEKFGRNFDTREKELVRKLEEFSLKNAYRVIFPSKGAEFFFNKTWEGEKVKYKKGEVAYNTLLDDNMKEVVLVDELKKDDSFVTFFSIGQMTESKGMDRIPNFLARLARLLSKKVRWIAVANGVLKENVIADMKALCSINKDIVFHQFDFMDHEQINYIFSISDIYIMLHRVSIFDLATLEAMYHDLRIVLSDVPGNREYNIKNNIYLVNSSLDYRMLAKEMLTSGFSNRKIYDKCFSNDAFIKRYREIIDDLVTN